MKENTNTTITQLRNELTYLQKCLREKNLALDAMHFVWCNGGCTSGVHRWIPADLTEEIVLKAERNTRRLRTWFTNKEHRDRWNDMPQAEREAWLSRPSATAEDRPGFNALP